MAKKLNSFRLYLCNPAYGMISVEADRYDLAHDSAGFGYILFFVDDVEVGLFPVKDVAGVVQQSGTAKP